ncbi:MAG: DUF5320 domain-containing protein [FCB group bacterium]|nr:DUF5320 domain-containing protein [FCB group bacterium]
MPGGDKTGPRGDGPMTGRGAGFCAGNSEPGFADFSYGRGFGGRRGGGFGHGFQGGGRGRRNRNYAAGFPGWGGGNRYANRQPAMPPIGPEAAVSNDNAMAEELAQLKEQSRYYKGVLDHIEARINELQR